MQLMAAFESVGIPFKYLSESSPLAKVEKVIQPTPSYSNIYNNSFSESLPNIDYLGWWIRKRLPNCFSIVMSFYASFTLDHEFTTSKVFL